MAASRGYSLVVVRGLIAVASLVGEHGLYGAWASVVWLLTPEHRLKRCSARASLLRGMWDPPGSGIKSVSPALAGGFFVSELPGKP